MKNKKVVIAGSAKLQESINNIKEYFNKINYEILNYPRVIEKEEFVHVYPQIFRDFFESITNADMLFIMNEDKNGIKGYIGAETFAELTFGLTQKLVYNKQIDLVIFKMPSKEVQCYEEINLWLQLGWINLYKE